MIDLAKITTEGLRLSGAEDKVPLEGGEILHGLAWELHIQKSDGDFFIDVKAEATFEGTCCRCLAPADTPTRLRAQFLGSQDPALVARGAHTLGAQDLDLVYLPDGEMDELALVVEQFILTRPMQTLCRETCLGLCPHCGKNLNKGLCPCVGAAGVAAARPPGGSGVAAPTASSGALARALAGIRLDGGT